MWMLQQADHVGLKRENCLDCCPLIGCDEIITRRYIGRQWACSKQVENLGATITLTEINKKPLNMRDNNMVETFEFDADEHDLYPLIQVEFDVVFAKTCLMFAKDIDAFVSNKRINPHLAM